MRIITLHCDYIRFKPLKKAIKNPEDLKDTAEQEVKDPLVVLTAVEQGDDATVLQQTLDAIKKTAGEVKAKNLVLYPYAHLSSQLAPPALAFEFLLKAQDALQKDGFNVTHAPFGYYKELELKVKGHPLSELSKEFRVGGAPIDHKSSPKVQPAPVEELVNTHKLLHDISRAKLDTSKLKENDHRILGQKLDLFSFNEASPGSVFWHPRGLIIFNELLAFSRDLQKDLNYTEVSTPLVFDNKLWKVSGHWGLYKESMFVTEYEGRSAALKPMNCPGHMLLYRTKSRSYKDLPIRFSEYDALHRMELSGTLNGLFRVIRMHQDDAHIFVTEGQLQDEILAVTKLFTKILEQFGFTYTFTISVRSAEKKDKYLGDDQLWNDAEAALEKALKSQKIKFEKMYGEAKFYGPSLDVQIKDSLGREWQCSTLQLDFNLPRRFELEYIGADNKPHTPIVLHRAAFGTLERFIGILLEHLNGNLPLWLAPTQVRVVDFTDRNTKTATKVLEQLKTAIPDLRVDADFRSTTVNDKIRDSELLKIPYTIVIGDKEEQAKTIAVRERGKKPVFGVKLTDFVKELKEKIEQRK